MDGAGVKAMMQAVAHAVLENVDLLSESDRAIGDGDHGVGMRRAFDAVLVALTALNEPNPEQVMKASGNAIMAKGGGASGAIFGTLFRSGAKVIEGQENLDAEGFSSFLSSAVDAVQRRGGAVEGQKTMLDALIPAARASFGHVLLTDSMESAAQAAQAGLEATREMIAATGKARSLGERSLGYVDPGALSVSIILKAMSDYAAKT
jgi:dihydroxyacetone kinase-like protein